MKKVLLMVLSIVIFGNLYLSAQSWFINGNTLSANSSIGSNNGFAVLFESNGFERGRLTASGLWGFGATTPNAKVHINSVAGQNPLRITVASTTQLLMTSAGNVGIGPVLFPSTKLHVSGGTDAAPSSGGFIV